MHNRMAVVAGLVLLLAGAPAAAQDVDFRQISCRDFLAVPNDQKAIFLVFLAGYFTDKNSPPILYRDRMEKLGAAIGSHCGSHPDDDIVTAARTMAQ